MICMLYMINVCVQSWAQVVIPPVDWSIPVLVAISVMGTLLIFVFVYAR